MIRRPKKPLQLFAGHVSFEGDHMTFTTPERTYVVRLPRGTVKANIARPSNKIRMGRPRVMDKVFQPLRRTDCRTSEDWREIGRNVLDLMTQGDPINVAARRCGTQHSKLLRVLHGLDSELCSKIMFWSSKNRIKPESKYTPDILAQLERMVDLYVNEGCTWKNAWSRAECSIPFSTLRTHLGFHPSLHERVKSSLTARRTSATKSHKTLVPLLPST